MIRRNALLGPSGVQLVDTKNRKFYPTSNFHHPLDMSGHIFASSIYGSFGLQTHIFDFTSSNHGLHIDE